MEKRKPSLYSLSKYPNLEIVLDSQLASAGAHQAKVLEKCERNQKYIKSQTNSLKVVSAFIMLFVPFMFFIIYMNLIEDYDLSTFSTESTLIIFTSFLSIFLILTLIYTFLFGLFTTSSLMSGTSFKWLQTLPLSKGDLRKLGFMTLFRSLNISSILMIIAFPIMLLFLTQNIFTFLLSFVSSFLNTMFCISLLIIIGQKFSNLFSEQVRKSSRASVLRVISLISYFIIAFSSGFIMTLGIIIIDNLIGILGTSGTSDVLIMIFTLIPFPFAPSSLVALTLMHGSVPISIWLSSIIGTVIFALLIFGMYKVAIRSLRNITSSEFDYSKKKEIKKKSIDIIELDVKPSSPIRAYIKKDLVASFKDYQSLIFILMPILYPLIMVFSLGSVISQNVSSSLSIMILWAIIMLFNIVIPIILVMGLLNLEESGSSIMASLPIVPRDQAKAKITLMLIIHSLSLVSMAIVLTVQTQSLLVLILLVSSLPIIWSFMLLMFEMKVCLFGKMKYRYVLEEVNKKHKVWKWIGMIAAEIGFFMIIFIIGSLIFLIFDIIYALIGIIILGTISLTLTLFTLYKMFPKEEQSPKYETGGYLRNNPLIGAIVVLILYNAFPLIGSFFEGLIFIPWLYNLPFLAAMIIEFLWIQSFYAMFLLFVTPKGLKLPIKTRTLKEYAKEVKIANVKPITRNIGFGLMSFVIFGIIAFIGANLLGDYNNTFNLLFGQPNPYSIGWFIWIFMLQPGIWEELGFRGVIIPMLLKRYSNKAAILISSVIFGIAHGFNLINVLAIGENPIYVLFQVIYTFFLGINLGYLFIKTNSLIPSIIYHYLFDTIGLVLTTTLISDLFLEGVYSIGFIGVLPAVFGLIFTYLISKVWKSGRLTLKQEFNEKI